MKKDAKKKLGWKFWKTGPFKKLTIKIVLLTLPRLFHWTSSIAFRTCKVTVIGGEHEDQFLSTGKSMLFVSWHQGLIYFVFHFRNRNGVVITSKSEDGDLIARILEVYGFQTPPRGSSSRGGKEAMYEMIDMIKKTNSSGGLVADAPRGPFGIAKMGIIKIAKETGLPLLPVMWWPSKAIMLKNWDKTLIPLPFSKIVFYYEKPIYVPSDADDDKLEEMRAQLTDTLNKMHGKARQYFDK